MLKQLNKYKTLESRDFINYIPPSIAYWFIFCPTQIIIEIEEHTTTGTNLIGTEAHHFACTCMLRYADHDPCFFDLCGDMAGHSACIKAVDHIQSHIPDDCYACGQKSIS